MSKELSIAIVVGILIGFIIGFGIWRANKLVNITAPTQDSLTNTESRTTGNISNSSLISLSKPKENQILANSEVEVSGITTPNTYISLLSIDSGFIEKTNDKGVFNFSIPVSKGLNKFKVAVYSDILLNSDTEFQIVYSSEFFETEIKNTIDSSKDESSSESAEERSARLEIEILKKDPIAYIGTVTEITENKLEMEGLNSEILQANMDSNAKYINKEGKEIKFTDLAIGDHIAALGFKNDNDILATKRILITTPTDFSNRFMLAGSVIKIDKKVLSLISDNKTYEITFPKKWTGPEIKEVKGDDKVIVIGSNDDGKYTLEVIEIIPVTPN